MNFENIFSQSMAYHFFFLTVSFNGASLVAEWYRTCPPMQEMWVQSLDREDPLEKGMATHFSILAWQVSWTEEPGRLQSIGSQRVGNNWSNLTCMHAAGDLTFWPPSSNPHFPSPSTVSDNHKSDLFFHELVCCFWITLDMPDMSVPGIQPSDSVFLYTSKWSPW